MLKRCQFTSVLVLLGLLPVLPPRATAQAVPQLPPANVVRVAFTQHNNVFLMSANGGNKTAVTTRGTSLGAPHAVLYPQYAWSPDGRYLLLVKWTVDRGVWDLLLMDPSGKLLRTLARGPGYEDFFPTWALDRDQVIYVASHRTLPSGKLYHAVRRVGIQGHSSYMFAYAGNEGCGGGSPDPAERAYWTQAGDLGVTPAMRWSASQHLAIYTPSCTGGLNRTDTRTGKTESIGNGNWMQPALSAAGVLAVTQRSPSGINSLVLVNTRSGRVTTTSIAGELPSWSHDGRTLFFQRRVKTGQLRLLDQLGRLLPLQTYRTSLWRMQSNGLRPVTLFAADAFGFGPIGVVRGGTALVFSRVDNDRAIYRHRLAGNRVNPGILQRYAPGTNVQRLNLASGATLTLARNAGMPALQP